MASLFANKPEELSRFISDNIVGGDLTFQSPFGDRKAVYADYTASGRSLKFIEDYIQQQVLPWYGNTHTLTSVISTQISHLREEARLIIRNAVNASEYDCVIFTGSGTTGAINLLIHSMGLRPPFNGRIAPVVIHGPFEHHSNLLPWREMGAEVVGIPETASGELDVDCLEETLQSVSGSGRLVIGTFCAAANLTGVLTDVDSVTEMLHKYGALSFWDYATAAPYVAMDMNPVHTSSGDPTVRSKDAIFFSPHKFIGGVDSPGVLVAKKKLFLNNTPYIAGGGTVVYVTPSNQLYLQEVEAREEGGTPAIIGSIRVGLAMQLKEAVGVPAILEKEEQIFSRVMEAWGGVQELVLLGPTHAPRLPVISFLIKHKDSGLFLHYNFVCTLLNDLFGIQTRGGCLCAGPYGQSLLGIDAELADLYRGMFEEDHHLDSADLRRHNEYPNKELMKPGMTRLSLTYFMSEEEIDYIIKSVVMVAKHGWKLLPLYDVNPESAQFKHTRNHIFKDKLWLSSISYKNGKFECPPKNTSGNGKALDFKEALAYAEQLFAEVTAAGSGVGEVHRSLGDQIILLEAKSEEGRWFIYPREAQDCLKPRKESSGSKTDPPFTPRQYDPLRREEKTSLGSQLSPTQSQKTVPKVSTVNSTLSNHSTIPLVPCFDGLAENSKTELSVAKSPRLLGSPAEMIASNKVGQSLSAVFGASHKPSVMSRSSEPEGRARFHRPPKVVTKPALEPFPSALRPYGRSLQHREHLHTTPSRRLTKAKRNPLRDSLKPLQDVKARNLSEPGKDILSRGTAHLLLIAESILQEHNWGSNTHIRYLEEALAARDKQRTGYLEVNKVRDACSEIGLPLPDHVLLPLLGRCIASKATNLVRWIAFADLLYKACPLHLRQQPLHSTWKTSPVLGGGTYSTQPSSASDRLTNYNPVDRHSPEYAGGRDGIHLGLSRLPRTVTFASADVIQENAEEDAGHVLVLIHRTLSSFADEEGLIELDEVYRTVKNYTAVYPASLRVDMLQLRAFCEECSTPHRGLPLAHTDDVMDYLRECV